MGKWRRGREEGRSVSQREGGHVRRDISTMGVVLSETVFKGVNGCQKQKIASTQAEPVSVRPKGCVVTGNGVGERIDMVPDVIRGMVSETGEVIGPRRQL